MTSFFSINETDWLQRTLIEAGLHLNNTQFEMLSTYFEELETRNQHANLTRIARADVPQLQVVDSLLPFMHPTLVSDRSKHPLRVLDVGCGPGIPGFPLAIAIPEYELSFLESVERKVAFLQHAARTLTNLNVKVIQGRAEVEAHSEEHREQYDLVTARALAPLVELAEYLLPFARPGGKVVALKTQSVHEELSTGAKEMIELLGGTVSTVKEYDLPLAPLRDESQIRPARAVVIIEKTESTPNKYPRTAKKIRAARSKKR